MNEQKVSDIHLTKVNKDFIVMYFSGNSSNFSIVDQQETVENNIKLDFIHYLKS